MSHRCSSYLAGVCLLACFIVRGAFFAISNVVPRIISLYKDQVTEKTFYTAGCNGNVLLFGIC
jgi:hypothetical protein|eukprot:COSAG06_NODE_2817_length_6234_cov_9.629177_5_plen_63_part_00